MTTNEILHADLLDILFEHRNKDYGAYALRKHYDRRMATALGIMFLLVGVLALMANGKQTPNAVPQMVVFDDSVTIITLPKEEFPEEPAPPKAPAAVEKPIASEKFTAQIDIVPDKILIETDVPDQDYLIHARVDVIKTDGDLPIDLVSVIPARETGNGAAPTQISEEEKVYDFKSVEEVAAFPGGFSAFSSFLSRHLRTPDDLQPGEKKTVLAKFKVDKAGWISDIEILGSAGNAYDKEVIRVLKKMPKWKPARQNGHEVAIYFIQPVSFLGMQQ